MRFGVAAEIGTAGVLAHAGYDYIELAAAADLQPEEPGDVWEAKRSQIERMPVPVEVFNSFVRSCKIVGPDVDSARLKRYLSTAIERAAHVGAAVIVFGSGGARGIPEGWPRDRAVDQVKQFLRWCSEACERTGITVVIEPLCRAECNFINTVPEGAELVRELALPGIMNLADTYHMDAENEPLTHIVDSAAELAHVHTADTGRFAPGTGSYDHTGLFLALKKARYDGRLSIECAWQGRLEELAGPALVHLKSAYLEANA